MLLNVIILLVVLFCIVGGLVDPFITEYMRANPSEEEGAVRIPFDEFLRLMKTQGDQITAKWNSVEYCDVSGLTNFRLSFGVIDWLRYRRWLQRKSKEEQKAVAFQRRKSIDKALGKEE